MITIRRLCLRCCLELKPRVCGDGEALPLPLQWKRWDWCRVPTNLYVSAKEQQSPLWDIGTNGFIFGGYNSTSWEALVQEDGPGAGLWQLEHLYSRWRIYPGLGTNQIYGDTTKSAVFNSHRGVIMVHRFKVCVAIGFWFVCLTAVNLTRLGSLVTL